MKRNTFVVFSLAITALIDGYLLSGISFVGRAGITVAYQEYQFLKSWWKGGLLVFIIWLVFYFIQLTFKRRANKRASDILQAAFIMIAAAGLYLSYSDLHNSLSHRWLGTSFHLGVYMFWAGSIVISIFILLQKKQLVPLTEIEKVEM